MSNTFKIVFIAIGLIIGFLCSLLVERYAALHFDPTCTLGNLIQASSTILVGLIVATFIQKQSQADRKEKEIILRHLDLLIDTMTEFEKYKDGGVLTNITSALKKLSRQCKAVYDLVTGLKYPEDICNTIKFDDNVKQLRKLATETPINQIEDYANRAESSSVRDGIIHLADEYKLQLDGLIQEVKLRVFKAQIAINRT